MTINEEKLKKIQTSVRIGGKGTQRRKKKIVHKSHGVDDRKIQTSLKKLGAVQVPGFEEITFFKDDGSVMVFKNPKFTAGYQVNTYAVEGKPEIKTLAEILPSYLQQLNPGSIESLANSISAQDKNNSDQPPGIILFCFFIVLELEEISA